MEDGLETIFLHLCNSLQAVFDTYEYSLLVGDFNAYVGGLGQHFVGADHTQDKFFDMDLDLC